MSMTMREDVSLHRRKREADRSTGTMQQETSLRLRTETAAVRSMRRTCGEESREPEKQTEVMKPIPMTMQETSSWQRMETATR